jgi:hypothetical protein
MGKLHRDQGSRQYIDRSSADSCDSGAIKVGAGSSGAPRNRRLGFSNYGFRIGVYEWGADVDITPTDIIGTSNTLYEGGLSGTSSALPIINGAAWIVQGLANAALSYEISPFQVRKILTT